VDGVDSIKVVMQSQVALIVKQQSESFILNQEAEDSQWTASTRQINYSK
jgi:hypothetical protein